MRSIQAQWWQTGARWSAGALCVVFFAAVLVPHWAGRGNEPLFEAMAAHTAYLYAAAAIMGVIGWVDSYFLYRRSRGDTHRA